MYELLKQLKDAGFQIPLNSKGELICKAQFLARERGDFVSCDHQKCKTNLEEVYDPTTDELIEELGEGLPLKQLSIYGRDKDRWEVSKVGVTYSEPTTKVYGTSIKEALIKLYIELHKK